MICEVGNELVNQKLNQKIICDDLYSNIRTSTKIEVNENDLNQL